MAFLFVVFGLFQLGIFDFSFLQKERKIHIKLAEEKMNPVMALIMGFTFSFAWTPCIGPALSSVLIMGIWGNNVIRRESSRICLCSWISNSISFTWSFYNTGIELFEIKTKTIEVYN